MRRLLVLILFGAVMTASASPPLRVACVGDSITYGDRLDDRLRDAYPAVLNRLANGRFVAGNFGVNGATAIAGIPFRSWSATQACRDAMAFHPDVVVVMLGINDLAFPDLHNRYPRDLRRLVERFQALPSAPRLFLCTLTPVAADAPDAPVNRTIRGTLNPAIRAVAAQTGAGVIDISPVFDDRFHLFPDGLHPDPEGAELIAQTVLQALDSAAAPTESLPPAPVSGPPSESIRREARAARFRAELWLRDHPAPEPPPRPSPPETAHPPKRPEDVAALLPLLEGTVPAGIPDLFCACAELADALARIGQDTVFLDDSRPVAWREALLHQLVQRQRIDSRGRGFWGDGDDAADRARATACALRALEAAGIGP
ncbi:MAG TPA: GDSL-type esterase/lipase family protein [Kiritimatiellia bacterium]|nr:GDSL-type esterase/lipase family protein [Kiritimatiellia bacterium]